MKSGSFTTSGRNPQKNDLHRLDAIATLAGNVLNGSRLVRGKDNPNIEYSPWTLFPNLPWSMVGGVRHRMMFNCTGTLPSHILHAKTDLGFFPGSKHIKGTDGEWKNIIDKNQGWFVVGEDISNNDFFGLEVKRDNEVEELAGITIADYIISNKKNVSGFVVTRMLLPKTAASFSKFGTIVNGWMANGEVYIVPGLTPHNLECYVTMTRNGKITTIDNKTNFWKCVYNMYHASLIVNWARTVSYCLMLPGVIGQLFFFPKKIMEWFDSIRKNYNGEFVVDPTSTALALRRDTLTAFFEGIELEDPRGKQKQKPEIQIVEDIQMGNEPVLEDHGITGDQKRAKLD